MRAKIDIKDLNRMVKLAGKVIDKRTSFSDLEGKIVLSVRDGKFEVYAVSTKDTPTDLLQWIPVENEYHDDFECEFAVEEGEWW